MRANPQLLNGANKLWVRFFLLAVYATMYVRDHARPEFHKALGIDPTDYDYQVFRVCTDISRQVFPVMLDHDNPRFRAGMERLREISDAMGEAKDKGGLMGSLKRFRLGAAAGFTFAKLYFMRTKPNALPDTSRLQPAW
jgi:magnesium-protoporphyrin IX monomethyl ester (oxidative) cyclase